MLAEQVFSTELRLPRKLRDKARVLGNELAWTASDAKVTILWLALEGCAVVGVELWRDEGGYPLWVATSDYSPSGHDAITPEEVARCGRKAGEFVEAHRHEPDVLFNLAWLEPAGEKTC